MRVRFEVRGVPPKKDGANSMWKKRTEVPRIIALREAAFTALGGERIPSESVTLRLRVWAASTAGDLDNFLTGICDGLQYAGQRAAIDPSHWTETHSPFLFVAFADDRCVDRIEA